MIRKLFDRLEERERRLRKSIGSKLNLPEDQVAAERHVRWFDHGFFRVYWHNFAQFAPGAYRSNHPDHARLQAAKDKGIKAILNLRGVSIQPYYQLEAHSCEALGLTLVTSQMAARRAPKVNELTRVIEALRTIERPFLMHCKSGADRTGLAAVLYLMLFEGKTLEEARPQLSFKFLHIRRIRTGILDHFLDVYEARNAADPIPIDRWIETEYDPTALTESFAAKQKALWFWQGWR